MAVGGVLEIDFVEFYRLEFGRVARAVRAIVGTAAEDVAQEAFLAAHARWDEIAASTTCRTRGCGVSRCGSRRDAAQRDRMRNVLESAIVRHDEPPESEVDLALALAGLPEREASALRAHHLEDRPVAEVAERLGCSVGAAKLLLLRSRRRLAERVGGLAGRWVSERCWTPDAIAPPPPRHGFG